jgi:hypothetical protein
LPTKLLKSIVADALGMDLASALFFGCAGNAAVVVVEHPREGLTCLGRRIRVGSHQRERHSSAGGERRELMVRRDDREDPRAGAGDAQRPAA